MIAKRCVCCGRYFAPYVRKAGEQEICRRSKCRNKRKRARDREWWAKNPCSLQERKKKTRIWAGKRNYWKEYRGKNSDYAKRNREQSRVRMKQLRWKRRRGAEAIKHPVEYLERIKVLGSDMFAKQDSLWQKGRGGNGVRPTVFAKQDLLTQRLDGVFDYLILREMFAKQEGPDSSGPVMVKQRV